MVQNFSYYQRQFNLNLIFNLVLIAFDNPPPSYRESEMPDIKQYPF